MITVIIYPLKIGNLKNFNQNLEYFLLIKEIFHKICYGTTFDKAFQFF